MIREIMIDITNKCNYMCKHCYKEINTTEQSIPLDTIIDWCMFCRREFGTTSVVLSGGETLLYPKIDELLSKLKDFTIRLNTNGYYLDKYISGLLQYKNLVVAISLDGYDDETYFCVRNNHYFNKVIDNAVLAKSKSLNIVFQTVLTTATVNQYRRFIQLSENLQIPVIIHPIVNTDKFSQQTLVIPYPRLEEWYNEVEENGDIDYVGGQKLQVKQSCRLLHLGKPSKLVVTWNGNIYPCPTLEYASFLLGNIYSFDMSKYIKRCTEVSQKLKNIINCSQCLQCGFRKKFGDGSCVPVCYYSSKKCIYEKMNDMEEV